MRREIWIAAAVGLSLTGVAHAQQTDHPHGTGSEPDTDTKAQEAQAHERQAQTDEMKQQESDRLSLMEDEGIELSALDGEQVKQVQTALQESDYYKGEIDGIPGKETKQALSQFYRDQAQLAKRGMISPQAAAAVGLEEAEIELVSGEDEEPTQGTQPPQQQPPQQQNQQPPSVPQQPPSAPQPPPSGPQPPPSTPQPQSPPPMLPEQPIDY
jgi:hypothetical protein